MGKRKNNKRRNNKRKKEEIPESAKPLLRTLKDMFHFQCSDLELYTTLVEIRGCVMKSQRDVEKLVDEGVFKRLRSRHEKRKQIGLTHQSSSKFIKWFVEEKEEKDVGDLEETACQKENEDNEKTHDAFAWVRPKVLQFPKILFFGPFY